MYHPGDLTAAEITAGFTGPDQFEFVEIKNIGPVLVDLAGARFIDGIDYDFAPDASLDARYVDHAELSSFLSKPVSRAVVGFRY